jgi:hypothetical protein
MLYQNEAVMFLIALCVFILTIENRIEIKKSKNSSLLLITFYIFLCGWIFTIVEGYILPDILNVMEHLSYLFGSISLAIWCWKFKSYSKIPKK